MKKVLSFLLAALMVFPLAACGGKDESYTTVSIWHYYANEQKTAFDKMVSDFNATRGLEKNIIVTADSKLGINDLAAAVTGEATAENGEMPNMFMTYSDTAYEIDKLGKVASLSPYFTDAEFSTYVRSYIDEGRITDGEVKIFPIAKATEVLMVNKTDWDAFTAAYNATVPQPEQLGYACFETVEGIVEAAEKYYNFVNKDYVFTEDGEPPKVLFARDALANYILSGMMSSGVDLFSVKENKVTFNPDKTAFKKVWQNYCVPYYKGWFGLNDKFATGSVKDGSLLAFVGSTSSSTYFPKTIYTETGSHDVEAMVMPAPRFAAGKNVQIQQGAGISVSKSDEKTEAACAEFLKWFTETDRNIEFSLTTGYLPVKKEAQDMNKIHSVIEIKGLTVPEINIQTMEVAFAQLAKADMYANKPFDGGVDARKVLENIKGALSAGRAAIVDSILAGDDKATVEDYVSDEAFETFVSRILTDLEKSVAGA